MRLHTAVPRCGNLRLVMKEQIPCIDFYHRLSLKANTSERGGADPAYITVNRSRLYYVVGSSACPMPVAMKPVMQVPILVTADDSNDHPERVKRFESLRGRRI